jgi:hypothetical protein
MVPRVNKAEDRMGTSAIAGGGLTREASMGCKLGRCSPGGTFL